MRLVAAAEHEFRLMLTSKSGVTRRAMLKQAGRTAELKGPAFPRQAVHVWGWFMELHAGRTGNGFGPNALSWSDIKAWSDLTGQEVRPEEVAMIRALDSVFLAVQAKREH